MGAPLSSLSAPTPHRTHTMGRRKIDIEYLQDDRVRKVTFCKRKGGLFKKAEDLAVLCGCEVTVLISNNNKTYEMTKSSNGRSRHSRPSSLLSTNSSSWRWEWKWNKCPFS